MDGKLARSTFDTLRGLVGSPGREEVAKTHTDLRGTVAKARLEADALVAWLQAPPEKKLPAGRSCGDCICFGCKCQALGQTPEQRVCRFTPSGFQV